MTWEFLARETKMGPSQKWGEMEKETNQWEWGQGKEGEDES